jgi:hypothetical protein
MGAFRNSAQNKFLLENKRILIYLNQQFTGSDNHGIQLKSTRCPDERYPK